MVNSDLLDSDYRLQLTLAQPATVFLLVDDRNHHGGTTMGCSRAVSKTRRHRDGLGFSVFCLFGRGTCG
jgi:hypothetical protein